MKNFNLFSIMVLFLLCVVTIQGQNYRTHQLRSDTYSREHLQQQKIHSNYHFTNLHSSNFTTANPEYLKWIWDTIITFDTIGLRQRITRTDDANCNELIELTEQESSKNSWQNVSKYVFYYNVKGNVDSLYENIWHNNAWIIGGKQTRTYDLTGNMLTRMNQFLNSDSGKIVNDSKEIYTYDVLTGSKVTLTNQRWKKNGWNNSSQDTCTYQNGNISTDTWRTWNGYQWVDSIRSTYSYNVGKIQNINNDYWRNGSWHVSGRASYNYTYTPGILIVLYEKWSNNSWINDHQQTFTYDSNSNLITEVTQPFPALWNNFYTYSYDANGNSITGKYEIGDSVNWHPYIGTPDIYSQKAEVYKLPDIYRYEARWLLKTCYPFGLSNLNVSNRKLSVFPNPASETITVETPIFSSGKETNVSIYNLFGQQFGQQLLDKTTSVVELRNLPKGLYILKVSCGDIMECVKFVKE